MFKRDGACLDFPPASARSKRKSVELRVVGSPAISTPVAFASMKSNLQAEILETIRYFSFFSYPPNEEEIHAFLKKRTSQGQLSAILTKLVKKGAITIKNFKLKTKNYPRYTLGEYSISGRNSQFPISNFQLRKRVSLEKVKKIQPYINLLSRFSQIKLIGLSGSVAMLNAERDHDVDLFIITARKRLWTGRLVALLLASLFRLRRKRSEENVGHKVCLNLFFDEANMSVPKFKQTEYVAHEVLQMKSLVSKNRIYEAFLKQNSWVYGIFPNALENPKFEYRNSKQIQNSNLENSILFRISDFVLRIFTDSLELILKQLQLTIIKLHQTNEIVTDTQLWFHPSDFGKKIHSNILGKR